MANQPYYPKREGDQSLWFTNIQSKIGNYYAALEISPARQAKLTLVLQLAHLDLANVFARPPG